MVNKYGNKRNGTVRYKVRRFYAATREGKYSTFVFYLKVIKTFI